MIKSILYLVGLDIIFKKASNLLDLGVFKGPTTFKIRGLPFKYNMTNGKLVCNNPISAACFGYIQMFVGNAQH